VSTIRGPERPVGVDEIQYRGWRIWVSTPLGFFALVLVLLIPVLGALAATSPTLKWLAGAALIGFPAGLVLLVARLAISHPHALHGSPEQHGGVAGERRQRRRRKFR
jgi:hypothetical protein